MKVFAKLMVLVMGVLLVGGRAMAQDKAVDPWTVSATLNSQFSDNRDGTENDKESNVDVSFTPRVDFRVRDGERSLLDLFLMPSVKWHSNPRSESSGAGQNDTELFGAVGADLSHQVTQRLGIKAGDTLSYNDDPEISQGGANVRLNASHWLNDAHAGADMALTEKVGASVSGGALTKRYTDSTVADNQDEDAYRGEADLKYMMGSGYNVFGLVGWTDFNAESSGAGARDRGSQVMSYGVGVERIFSPDVVGKVIGGFQTAEYDDATLDSTDTANGSAQMTFRKASPTRFSVAGSYGYFAPSVRPYSIQTLTAVSGAIDHDVLAERLTVTLRGQYSEGEYDDEGTDLPGGTDKFTTVGVGVRYWINRNWSIRGGYSHEKWDSDVRESFDRNLVDLGVTAQL
jgi:hypothetical protein